MAQVSRDRVGIHRLVGDGDPMDVAFSRKGLSVTATSFLRAVPIGGLRMIDRGQADDNIIALLKDDPAYGDWSDIYQVPPSLIDRLRHYFVTYKEVPGESGRLVEIAEVYGRRAAHDVIKSSCEDYRKQFSDLHEVLSGMPGDDDEAVFIGQAA